jgi:hypothetical protein
MANTGPMAIGEERTIMAGDRVLTIRRTKRDYIFDYCDALNASTSNGQVEWYVHNSNSLSLRGVRQRDLL